MTPDVTRHSHRRDACINRLCRQHGRRGCDSVPEENRCDRSTVHFFSSCCHYRTDSTRQSVQNNSFVWWRAERAAVSDYQNYRSAVVIAPLSTRRCWLLSSSSRSLVWLLGLSCPAHFVILPPYMHTVILCCSCCVSFPGSC